MQNPSFATDNGDLPSISFFFFLLKIERFTYVGVCSNRYSDFFFFSVENERLLRRGYQTRVQRDGNASHAVGVFRARRWRRPWKVDDDDHNHRWRVRFDFKDKTIDERRR